MELSISLEKSHPGFTLAMDETLSGERLGIFGPSGSGKSTLAAMIAGLEKPDRGRIVLDGETLFDSDAGIDLPPERRRIAMVFQSANLFPHLKVEENLLYGYRRTPAALRAIPPEGVVEALGLGSLLRREVAHLSGGERQRVALGRAILANPRLLVMDEPLSALDDDLRFQIIPYLRGIGEQFRIPYIYISHSLVEMRLLTDRVLPTSRGSASPPIHPKELALQRMGGSHVGFINLLRLPPPFRRDGILHYPWGNVNLQLAGEPTHDGEALYELSSRDIILCREHPRAISARNLLPARVLRTLPSGPRTGVLLDFGGMELVAEIAGGAAAELEISPGATLYAVIKASAFRRLG